jgi:hypothetical protein
LAQFDDHFRVALGSSSITANDPERDREARFRFGVDIGAAARAILAITKWQLGEVGPAWALSEEAVAHAIETGHVPTLVATYVYKANFEIVRSASTKFACASVKSPCRTHVAPTRRRPAPHSVVRASRSASRRNVLAISRANPNSPRTMLPSHRP